MSFSNLSYINVIENESAGDSGGIRVSLNCLVSLDHILIADNEAATYGAAFAVGEGSTVNASHLTVVGNTAPQGEIFFMNIFQTLLVALSVFLKILG